MTIRASDDDRQRTVTALERHTGAGRLTLDEFAERAQLAHDARTLDDLNAVVSDLPVLPDADGPRRDLLVLFAVAALTLLILGVFIAVTR
ncbi:DUF1707 SHOCT-like domain-containing protein [Actinoplanes sp. CA-030573]|uniref:DUF1707 SHOCT-like domain-containing protein n=1 Tax=Actinoplanes sp. CA-030573 TaxID=3239898 RepID=UPI003D8BA045